MASEASGQFEPDEALLTALLSMGIAEAQAHEALFCTGNESVEAAVNYVFSNIVSDSPENFSFSNVVPDSPQNRLSEALEGAPVPVETLDDEEEGTDKRYKMAFVVNKALPMGVGKIAAQVGHACLGLYRQMLKEGKKTAELNDWEYIGEKKIVLKGDSAEHLEQLYNKACELSIPCYLVSDAGHTQIPSGSITVLSIFGHESDVNAITGGLSLL